MLPSYIRLLWIGFFLLIFFSQAWAATSSLTVTTCSQELGTVIIANCSGLNTSNDTSDVTIAKNASLGLAWSDTTFSGTISSVTITIRHSGASGISGRVGLILYDGQNSSVSSPFCTENTSISNTTSYTTHTITACTPTGGWDTTKLNNLKINVNNNDIGMPQNMFVSYVSVGVTYTPIVCGNSIVESGETCDDGGTTSNDGCSSTCQTETGWTCSGTPSSCTPICGDTLIKGSEACDGANLNSATCVTQGFSGGTLTCNGTCTGFVTSSCYTCGNVTIELGETCDGTSLNGQTCSSQGYTGGTLTCAANCLSFNTSACTSATCGNNIIEGSETCDGTSLNSQTCFSQGYLSGTLACAANCSSFDTSACVAMVCGNNIIEGSEVCDGTALNSETCTSLGFDSGSLACESDCSAYQTSSCVTSEICGNSTIAGPEVCDGSNLDSETCVSQGFESGTLTCESDCLNFDTSSCAAPITTTTPTCGYGCCGSRTCDIPTGEDYYTCRIDCSSPYLIVIHSLLPSSLDEFSVGDQVIIRISIDADSQQNVRADSIKMIGEFGELELLDDGQHGDLAAGDFIYGNFLTAEKSNTPILYPFTIKATIAQTTQTLESGYQIVPLLYVNVTTPRKKYSQGDIITFSGRLTQKMKPVQYPVDIILEAGDKILFTKQIIPDQQGKFSFDYQISTIDPLGEWKLTATSRDDGGNFGFIIKKLQIFEPQTFVNLGIELLTNSQTIWERGSIQTIVVRVRDQLDELVENATVQFIPPVGNPIPLIETEYGNYSAKYSIPQSIPKGKQPFIVRATQQTAFSTKQGSKTFDIPIGEASLTILLLEPSSFLTQVGEELSIRLRVSYPQGQPLNDIAFNAYLNGKEVSFLGVEPGIFVGKYVVELGDLGRPILSIAFADQYDNTGTLDLPLIVNGISPLYYVRTYFLIVVGLLVVMSFLFQSSAKSYLISFRRRMLESKERQLLAKIKELQTQYYQKGALSKESYQKLYAPYAIELQTVRNEIIKNAEKDTKK
ncbi:MAG: DUF4215 domain-containing protein [Candidatus Diapherotrites archaeon]